MALNWQWAECSGTVTYGDRTQRWWEGNAMMIVLDEFKDKETGDDMYNLAWFFADEVHAKRMLGLAKGYKDNFLMDMPVTELTIHRKHCWQWPKIVQIFTKAFPGIKIVLEE